MEATSAALYTHGDGAAAEPPFRLPRDDSWWEFDFRVWPSEWYMWEYCCGRSHLRIVLFHWCLSLSMWPRVSAKTSSLDFCQLCHHCHRHLYSHTATALGFYVMPKSGEKETEERREISYLLENERQPLDGWKNRGETMEAEAQRFWAVPVRPRALWRLLGRLCEAEGCSLFNGSVLQDCCTELCQQRPQWNWPDCPS